MVRVKVLIKAGERELETAALVNTGYGSDEPEIVVPARLAEKLGMWPEFPKGTKVEVYSSIGGVVSLYLVPRAASVILKARDRDTKSVPVHVVISDKENEVLLSDKLLDALNIELKRPGAGIWKFLDDPPDRERVSESPEYW